MFKHFLVGAILGLLTLVLLAVMFNFVTGITLTADGTDVFSAMNAFGVIIAYGLAMAIIGSLVDRSLTKKRKKK